ncbi:hypothetical protein [Streptomyces sp. NBC_00670]|uniref:hypothetical protein n=1 Tax=Streptomyces sp. NBC_00670 TaxID=2975804 RepID=UPI002E3414D9|nr:hypothetical protein [Streptomyces sp. NBC_00670]
MTLTTSSTPGTTPLAVHLVAGLNPHAQAAAEAAKREERALRYEALVRWLQVDAETADSILARVRESPLSGNLSEDDLYAEARRCLYEHVAGHPYAPFVPSGMFDMQ